MSKPRPGLMAVPPHQPRPHYSALALWHLLSLDAPTVAALWTVFIALCSHLHLPWTEPAAMFVAVWMIYAADRLLDGRPLDIDETTSGIEPRHRFHHRHRTSFLTAILLSSVALAVLLHRIDARALHLYALLATLLAGWMLLIHVHPQTSGAIRRLPKELAVGIFFPAAVFIPTLARTSALPVASHALGWAANWIRPTLLPSAILFACVCSLNCLCLFAWEHPIPRQPTPHPEPPARQTSNAEAHWTTRWATARLTYLALAILAASTIASVSMSARIALPALACSLSTAALFALNLYRRRLSPTNLRAAADLVLLTPILFLPFVR